MKKGALSYDVPYLLMEVTSGLKIVKFSPVAKDRQSGRQAGDLLAIRSRDHSVHQPETVIWSPCRSHFVPTRALQERYDCK